MATERPPPLVTEMEDRLVEVDFEQSEVSAAKVAAFAEPIPLGAVLAVDDQGILTAAHTSALLGLVHNPPDAVAATRDKVQMRSVLASWAVPQPASRVAGPGADAAALAVQVGLPCVVKPVQRWHSKGCCAKANSSARPLRQTESAQWALLRGDDLRRSVSPVRSPTCRSDRAAGLSIANALKTAHPSRYRRPGRDPHPGHAGRDRGMGYFLEDS